MSTVLIKSIVAVALVVTAIVLPKPKDRGELILKSILMFMLSILALLIISTFVQEDTQKECLKGNKPYRMEIQYELKDSVYVPVDTVFAKVNK